MKPTLLYRIASGLFVVFAASRTYGLVVVQFEPTRQDGARCRDLEARMKPSVPFRIAAVLLLLFEAGHTPGFPWSDPKWGVDLGSMRSTAP